MPDGPAEVERFGEVEAVKCRMASPDGLAEVEGRVDEVGEYRR